MIVPRRQASSISNNVSPGTQPSATAFSQVLPPLRCPTITLKPLSRKLSDCPGPCTPYPITAIVSFFNTSRAFSKGNSSRVRSEEHTSELQSRQYLVCRLLLEKKKKLEYYTLPSHANNTR